MHRRGNTPESPDSPQAMKSRTRTRTRTRTRAASPIESAIANANNIVRNYITADPLTEFTVDGPNEIGFASFDPVTGVFYAGSYEYNAQGIVTGYGFKIFASDLGLSDLFIWTELGGGAADFGQHASTFEATIWTYQEEFGAAWVSGNEQYLANWIDSMPGANHYNPLSTAVDINGDNNFGWA